MPLRAVPGPLLVAVTALAFGFLLGAQLRVELIAPSNRVARNEALVRSVQGLEGLNAGYRARISSLRSEIDALEAQASARSEGTRQLNSQVSDLRTHAGLTPLRGPGVSVSLANGRPLADAQAGASYLVSYEDVQDLVNTLYSAGAEGIAVNGRRLTPLTAFRGTGGAILIDQGPPLLSPYRVTAVGNRAQMEQALGDTSLLGDLRSRVERFGIQLNWSGEPDLRLPAYDSILEVGSASP